MRFAAAGRFRINRWGKSVLEHNPDKSSRFDPCLDANVSVQGECVRQVVDFFRKSLLKHNAYE